MVLTKVKKNVNDRVFLSWAHSNLDLVDFVLNYVVTRKATGHSSFYCKFGNFRDNFNIANSVKIRFHPKLCSYKEGYL